MLRDGACAGSGMNGSMKLQRGARSRFPKCRCTERWGMDCRHPCRLVSRPRPRPHAERGQCLATYGICSTGLTANMGM